MIVVMGISELEEMIADYLGGNYDKFYEGGIVINI